MKNERLKEGLVIFLVVCIVATAFINFVIVSARWDDLETERTIEVQVCTEELNALRTDYTALLEENEVLKDSYADMAGDMNAVREILKQLNYETILVEPEATDIWLQTCVDFLEGKL